MAVLGAVVHAHKPSRTHAARSRASESRPSRPDSCAIGRLDLAWNLWAGGKHAIENAFGGDLVAPYVQGSKDTQHWFAKLLQVMTKLVGPTPTP
jgi:hypothetical protein